MGKNIKSYATTPSPFQQIREGSLTAKGPNLSFTIWYGLTVHIIHFKITSKIFKIVSPSQIPANYANSMQFACTVREFHKNSHILHYVSGTCPGREPCKIPVNYANSTQFTHTVREFREIRTFC